MKKQVLVCGIVAMMSQNVAAQEKNYRDEYILVTEEYEVGDTIEAKRKAEEQARIENEQILEANAFRLGIVNVIDSLINNKIKKVKDERSLQIIKDAYDYKKWRFVSREEEDAAKTGKLVGRAYNMLSEYKKHQQEEYRKESNI